MTATCVVLTSITDALENAAPGMIFVLTVFSNEEISADNSSSERLPLYGHRNTGTDFLSENDWMMLSLTIRVALSAGRLIAPVMQ